MNLKNKLSLEGLVKKKSEIKKIFFFRICGTGMGAAACLLREKGYEVEGADLNFFPPMSDYLEKTNITLYSLKDLDWDYLKTFDLIVVGNVVPRMSDDARKIEEIGIPFCSFPAVLGAFVLHDLNVVGIAGTHGKTTTTYFMSQIFDSLDAEPGYFIGGVIDGIPSSKLGKGRYFFIESDEYDSSYFEKFSKFRSYTINHLVMTSLEFDHADIFDSIEDIKNEFSAILKNFMGTIIAHSGYEAINQLSKSFDTKAWYFYGENSENGPRIEKTDKEGTTFLIRLEGDWQKFETNVVGAHNILNLSTCILFAQLEGFEIDKIKKAVRKLKFVKRRQELRGFYRTVPVIDDFAHHPRSVSCTINAVKTSYPEKEVVVIFEPNSATARSDIFQKEFSMALSEADNVIIAKPVRDTTVKGASNLDYQKISEDLKTQGRGGEISETLEELRKNIDKSIGKNSLILILSNGTCLDLWKSDFVKELTPVIET